MKLNQLTVYLTVLVVVAAFSIPAVAAGFGRGGAQGAMGLNADGQCPFNDGECLNPDGPNAGAGAMGIRGRGLGQRGGFFLRGLVGELELTDVQRDQIDTILADFQDAMLTLAEQMGTARLNLSAAIHADVFNETGVRQASRDAAAIQEEMNVLRALVISDVKTVLTAEQLELLNQWEAQRLERNQMRLESMGSRLDEWIEAEAQ